MIQTNLNMMSMPVVSHTLHSESGKNLREASFSSYLDLAEKTFILQLGDTTKTGLNSSVPGKNKTEDLEIDVFDAQRYFNEGLNSSHRVAATKNLQAHQFKKDDTKEQAQIGSPSIPSESSKNSRSGLLHIVPRNKQQQTERRTNKKSFLTGICCNFSCNDNSSVDIDNFQDGESCCSKSTSISLSNDKSRRTENIKKDHFVEKSQLDNKFIEPGHFSFPVFTQTVKMQVKEEELKPVEMFGSPILQNGKNSQKLEKKFTKICSIESEMENDSDSNASSSDLFEIESLSKGNPFLSRQASDGMSESRNLYAPSEASIEWSVITASAADFSVLSDFEELKSIHPPKTGVKSRNGPKTHVGILSGCKSQKAVQVAGDAHRLPNDKEFYDTRKSVRSQSVMSVTRFQEERKRMDFNARNRQRSFDARVLSQTASENAAHLLYTW